jgi:hypothetical protein
MQTAAIAGSGQNISVTITGNQFSGLPEEFGDILGRELEKRIRKN